jgi:hypothetical protein
MHIVILLLAIITIITIIIQFIVNVVICSSLVIKIVLKQRPKNKKNVVIPNCSSWLNPYVSFFKLTYLFMIWQGARESAKMVIFFWQVVTGGPLPCTML